MANRRKLTAEQIAELALWAHRRRNWRHDPPAKTMAHRLGIGRTTVNRYLRGIRHAAREG